MISQLPFFSFLKGVGTAVLAPSSQTSLLTAARPGPFAISSPQKTRLTSATFHSLPEPQGRASQLGTELGLFPPPPRLDFHHHRLPRPDRTYPSFAAVSVSQVVLEERPSCPCSGRLIHSLHDEVRQEWQRPQQRWMEMTEEPAEC